MTDRSWSNFSNLERHPGVKLYRPVTQVFILKLTAIIILHFLSLVNHYHCVLHNNNLLFRHLYTYHNLQQ